MKILKTDSFVSERIKVQPITNADLDVAKKLYANIVDVDKILKEYNICKFDALMNCGKYGIVSKNHKPRFSRDDVITTQESDWYMELYDNKLKHTRNEEGDILAVYEPDDSAKQEIKDMLSKPGGVTDEDLEKILDSGHCTLVWKRLQQNK